VNNINVTRIFVYLLIGIGIAAAIWGYSAVNAPTNEISITQLAQAVRAGEVAEINVNSDGRSAIVAYIDESRPAATAQISSDSSLEATLAAYGVTEISSENGRLNIIYSRPSSFSQWFSDLAVRLPAVLFLVFF
jgi:hypothetical protein